MNKQLTTKIYLFIVLLVALAPLNSFSQNLTGIWRGYFIADNGSQYKFEMQIKQSNNSVTGVSYSYLSTVFYGKATLTGSFNKLGSTALIREIKTTELRMSEYSAACIMKCIFDYSKSGKEEFLEGTYTSVFEKDAYGAAKGEDCGGGKVVLRKVVTSDFYVEPFLRKSLTPPPVIENKPKTNPPVVTTKPKTNTPVVVNKPKANPPVTNNKPVVKTKTPVTKTTNTPDLNKNNTIVHKPVPIDSVEKITTPPVVKSTPVITPNVLKTRTNELVKTLVISDRSVTIKIYDNGEIDDDTISVYLDKKLVLSNKRLTTAALVVKLQLDEDNPEHELVMVAENLGRIPPNTSLMIVEAGEQRFDVRITSTEQKNAVVRFRYEKPH